MRRSWVSSGWKAVASSFPCRTATILPVPSSVPRMLTPGPVCSTHGALINTARNERSVSSPWPPPTPSRVISRSKERSEEHTSELQSPDHLVCRLLLEKKNKTRHDTPYQYNLRRTCLQLICA